MAQRRVCRFFSTVATSPQGGSDGGLLTAAIHRFTSVFGLAEDVVMHRPLISHYGCALALAVATVIAGCSGVEPEGTFPNRSRGDSTPYNNHSSVFGPGGLSFGGDSAKPDEGGSGGIPVNGFLWRASLDTVAFMPVASADPFGGVIITDWYAMPESPDERFKLNVYIVARSLRADGVRVAVFRQVQTNGSWQDASVTQETNTRIEDAILSRARQLRFDTLQQTKS